MDPTHRPTGLNAYVRDVRALCDAKGFSSSHERIWEMLALIHTEISEATDCYKKGRPLEEVGEELVDALIRIFHLLSALDDQPDPYRKPGGTGCQLHPRH